MGMHVYVGKVQSETFDYEIAKAGKGDYHGYGLRCKTLCDVLNDTLGEFGAIQA